MPYWRQCCGGSTSARSGQCLLNKTKQSSTNLSCPRLQQEQVERSCCGRRPGLADWRARPAPVAERSARKAALQHTNRDGQQRRSGCVSGVPQQRNTPINSQASNSEVLLCRLLRCPDAGWGNGSIQNFKISTLKI